MRVFLLTVVVSHESYSKQLQVWGQKNLMENKFNFIAVEGPIGAGKTSLARIIGKNMGKEILLEDPDSNPFLEEFYQSREKYALATQLSFFLRRIEQMHQIKKKINELKFGLISDFLMEKDAIFANLNLAPEELKIYEKIYRYLKPETLNPDLVVSLQASPENLLNRVKIRGRVYEENLSREYISSVYDAYQSFFHSFDQAPLLIVNNDNLNFIDNTDHLSMLMERITGMRTPREFFGLSE